MNTKLLVAVALLAVGSALLPGCASLTGPEAAQDSTKYTIENTEKFVPLDKPTRLAVACTGLRERVRPDGHFEVVANLKNRDGQAQRLLVNCVFKDAHGFSIGDETPFQKLVLGGNATETVRFTANNTLAKRYTIRVKQAW